MFTALLRIGWRVKRRVRGSHRVLMRPGWPDVVSAFHDRDEIGLLIFPNVPGLAQVAGLAADRPIAELIAHPAVAAALDEALRAYNVDHSASSMRVARALIMEVPPQLDANEITDKGYINQLAVVENRAELVTKLYEGQSPVVVVKR